MKRTALRRVSRLRAASPKRAAQSRQYRILRARFLTENPVCQFPNDCTRRATTIQHLRGRRGERLNDTAWWAASCLDHNLWAEDHTGEALAIGWLVRIEGVA